MAQFKLNKSPQIVNCACGLILHRGKVLLGMRSAKNENYPRVWDLFGGHVEGAEAIEEALMRELREELDIVPTIFEYLTAFEEPDPSKNGRRVYHVYKVTAWQGPGPRNCGSEHTTIAWHTLAEALSLNLAITEYEALLKDSLAS